MVLQIDSAVVINNLFTTSNVIEWILNSLICIFLTVLIYPYLENSFQSFVVKKLSFLKLSSGHKIAGLWTHRWHVESKNFQPINEIKQVEIKQFRKRVFAQYCVIDNNGKIFTYQLLGKVDKDQVITGIWKDIENGNRYHGCFQIYIDINEQTMHGYWIGLSRNQNIKSDMWEWIRE